MLNRFYAGVQLFLLCPYYFNYIFSVFFVVVVLFFYF